MTIYNILMKYKDENYKEFQSKLVPNISADTIIGVRTPDLRKIAKDLFDTKNGKMFLETLPHKYYEENLVHFFMIAMIKDFDACINETEKFLPYIDCWSVCDQSSPKIFRKNHNKLLPYIQKWISSEHIYTSRFGMRILMNEFLDEDFKPDFLKFVSSKNSNDYYLKMMKAWFFATALAKQYDASIIYIEEHKLDDWCHKKTIQKALESYRVTKEHKEYLKTLR